MADSIDHVVKQAGPLVRQYEQVDGIRGGWRGGAQEIDLVPNNITDRLYKVHGSGVYGAGRELKLSYIWHF